MRESVAIGLLGWFLLVGTGRGGNLEKLALRPNNVLTDYYAYRHISIIHFSLPEGTVAAAFKFTVKEEKTGGIGKCSPRNVSLYLKSGSLPLVSPDGAKIAAELMKERRPFYSLEVKSNGEQHSIRIDAPPRDDWYAIAFRSWTDPDNGKITQQGLGPSCDTVLDSELSVESSGLLALVAGRFGSQVYLNSSADSAIMQLVIPKGVIDSSVSLESSCGEECKIAVHITAEEHLASKIVNSSDSLLVPFRVHSDATHYMTLRLLSGEGSNVSVGLLEGKGLDPDQVETIELRRKSLPEFFMFDYEHVLGNEAKPSPFNITAERLGVLSFAVGRVYDVGGSLTVALKLAEAEGHEKKEIILAACISPGSYVDISPGGGCMRDSRGISGADIYVNSSGPSSVHIPFPEPGTWHVSLRAFSLEKDCQCVRACQNGSSCESCECMTASGARVESSIASSPCIEGRCNAQGKCMHYMSGGFVFAACYCTGGYRGFDCADDAYVLDNSGILLRVIFLTLSNLAFIGSIYVAIRREYFTEAIVYAAVMFFSTFYHACEAGEDVHSVCIMRLGVLQFCDFYNALLSIWVTLVAMASFAPKLTAFCQVAGAIILAMSSEMDRTALWVFLLPAVTGSLLIGLSWGIRCRSRRSFLYPSRPYRTIYFPAGLVLVALGLVCYAFLQTRSNYYMVHSFWHICVAIGVILLLPKRQYMK